jgi:hypothetical protein
MKTLFYTVTLLLLAQFSFAQHTPHVYQIRADTVRIYNTCDTAELVLENRTKDTLGFLYNKGKGRTEFRRLQLQRIGASGLSIMGQDTVDLDFGGFGDTRYDLFSTNFVTIDTGTSKLWNQWPVRKVVGYDAYNSPDMPVLSNQAFQSRGSRLYYNGLVVRDESSGFDMAVNWDGELNGPNGVFVRTKDDTRQSWSAWRELLFKDYADTAYTKAQGSTADLQTVTNNGNSTTNNIILSGKDTLGIVNRLRYAAGTTAGEIGLRKVSSQGRQIGNLYFSIGAANFNMLDNGQVSVNKLSVNTTLNVGDTLAVNNGYANLLIGPDTLKEPVFSRIDAIGSNTRGLSFTTFSNQRGFDFKNVNGTLMSVGTNLEGFVGINKRDPAARLDVNGRLRVSSSEDASMGAYTGEGIEMFYGSGRGVIASLKSVTGNITYQPLTLGGSEVILSGNVIAENTINAWAGITANHYSGYNAIEGIEPYFNPAGTATSILGTGYNVTVRGSDAFIKVTIQTGTGITSSGTIGTISFASPYTVMNDTPAIISSPNNNNALNAKIGFGNSTAEGFTIFSTANLAPSTTYTYSIMIGGL